MSQPDPLLLAARGWDLSAPVDLCHLDCTKPGYLKLRTRADGRTEELILCLDDAQVLEENADAGDYEGALTPADSQAAEWPWRLLEAAV